MCDDEDQRFLEPEVTQQLYHGWQKARRGSYPAEDMTNPVWEWLFRGRIDPYRAGEWFKPVSSSTACTIDFPSEPRWAGCRMGQSHTKLRDGRQFWIAGEHEDHYDPDFFIYNDVIVQTPDGRLQIFGYPESVFRPTDFHSSTAVDSDSAILLIGSIGYARDRREGHTQVYRLDTQSLQISEIAASGEHPGWLHEHSASLAEDGSAIVVRGGKVLFEGGFIENIDDWSLQLSDFCWTRLTDRRWPRLQIRREDAKTLHLWQYSTLEFHQQFPELDRDRSADLESELGAPPNVEAYKSLYRPAMRHELIETQEEGDGDWQTTHLLIDGVKVRIVDDMDDLKLIVEGKLPDSQIDRLADELRRKLALVENAPCVAKRIG